MVLPNLFKYWILHILSKFIGFVNGKDNLLVKFSLDVAMFSSVTPIIIELSEFDMHEERVRSSVSYARLWPAIDLYRLIQSTTIGCFVVTIMCVMMIQC